MSKYEIYRDEITRLLKDNNFQVYKVRRLLSDKYNLSAKSRALSNCIEKIKVDLSQITKELNERGVSSDDFKHGWIKTKQGSYFIKNDKVVDVDQVFEDVISKIEQHAYEYKTIKYPKLKTKQCLIIDIADLHIDKLDYKETQSIESFTNEIKTKIDILLSMANSFEVSDIVFILGNDILHTDTTYNTTTAGTPQDTTMMWYDAFNEALSLYVELIEKLSNISKVHCVFNPGNHDFKSGFYLAQTVKAWFKKSNDVSFDVDMRHRKYFQFGTSLIQSTHGDGAKESELPDLAKVEAKKSYAVCDHVYCIVHHLHHSIVGSYKGKKRLALEKDYRDVKVIHTGRATAKDRVKVEVVRSASGKTDYWHHMKGYEHTPNSVTAFIIDEFKGEIARFTI